MIYATANGAHNTLTKCTKMIKEEENITVKQEVLNGNGDCAPSTTTTTTATVTTGDRERDREEPPARSSAYTQHGGRLKFFKDGKFILELERSREGERVSWVSVPRKTFWPPQGTASSTPTYRQESSTSLSVSDDNSSIQSSPWQRDHSWKQTSPHKNLSKQLAFYYIANKKHHRAQRRSAKTRRPYDAGVEEFVARAKHAASNTSKPSTASSNSSPTTTPPPPPSAAAKLKRRKERRLHAIIQILTDKIPVSSPVRESVVSPRKRFLREMEKDSKAHADDACQKRSRGKPSAGKMVSSPVRTNGIAVDESVLQHHHHHSLPLPTTTSRQSSARNSSYSITSLLADDKNAKRSSPANSPSHYSPGALAGSHPYATPPPPQPPTSTTSTTHEDRIYSESVDRLRSIELSHVDKRLCMPYATPPSFMPPFMHPYTLAPHYFHALARGFPGLAAAAAAGPPTYPLPLAVRPEAAPSCSWAAEPARDTASDHRDDNIADMPLNLSKHAG